MDGKPFFGGRILRVFQYKDIDMILNYKEEMQEPEWKEMEGRDDLEEWLNDEEGREQVFFLLVMCCRQVCGCYVVCFKQVQLLCVLYCIAGT